MENTKKRIAKNLKKFRELAKLQQKEVAEMLGVKSNTLSNWENEKNSIDIETLLTLCEIYNVTLDEMYGIQYNHSDILVIKKEPHLTAINKYLNLNYDHQAGIRGMIDMYIAEEQQATTVAAGKGA